MHYILVQKIAPLLTHAIKNGIIVTLLGLVGGYALRWAFGKAD